MKNLKFELSNTCPMSASEMGLCNAGQYFKPIFQGLHISTDKQLIVKKKGLSNPTNSGVKS